ncbi:EpsG family protein [Vibrio diabolicus]|uniref:EpsG family protein n=1 Tax=Vibrio diabolicus TaxID=50719 RepID=UPI00228540EB|nr:EpsG family protein [Vibrio diabolicus]MCZ0760376.1 EpsG family protein [Vibrio diabolicus]
MSTNFGSVTLKSSIFVFALLISYLYIFYIPWESVTGREFTDVSNYINRMEYIYNRGGNEYSGVLSYITGEWLWAKILELIAVNSNDYRFGLLIISSIALFLYLLVAFREIPLLLVLCFLFNPLFVDLILSQVRIALAFSILLSCIYIRNKYILYLMIAMSTLIHTASVLFISIYFVIRFLIAKYGLQRRVYIYSIFFALIISMFLKFGVSTILFIIGDRRADFSSSAVGSSILYSSFWFILALILAMKSELNKKFIYVVAFSITMMCIFFFNSILGVYGQRFVAVSLVPIFISLLTLPIISRFLTILLFLLYQLFQYKYWIDISII